jgi:hypothetical protein
VGRVSLCPEKIVHTITHLEVRVSRACTATSFISKPVIPFCIALQSRSNPNPSIPPPPLAKVGMPPDGEPKTGIGDEGSSSSRPLRALKERQSPSVSGTEMGVVAVPEPEPDAPPVPPLLSGITFNWSSRLRLNRRSVTMLPSLSRTSGARTASTGEGGMPGIGTGRLGRRPLKGSAFLKLIESLYTWRSNAASAAAPYILPPPRALLTSIAS